MPGRGGGDIVGGMRLPVMPPVKPMLAKSVAEIPKGDFSYEPKWDGFRSIVFRDGDEVEIGSRNERPMTRYFPEVVEAVKANLPERIVVDGEIVVPDADGKRLEFEMLQQRIHPAESRVRLLAAQTPAHFVAFDLLALDDRNLMKEPFAERRRALEDALAGASSPIHVTPATTDRELAERWFDEFEGAGLDGVIAKPLDVTYQPDKRVMFKIKHERTADCVVAGYRVHKTDDHAIGSLLLGLYDADGDLANIGVVGALPMAQRRKLFEELQPLVTTFEGHPWNWAQEETRHPHAAPLRGSRWSAGKDLTFVPLRPERVVEIRYDHMEGPRLRHTAPVRALASRPRSDVRARSTSSRSPSPTTSPRSWARAEVRDRERGHSSANDPVTISPAGSYVPITTPVVETVLSTSFSPEGMVPSANRRLPDPMTSGKTHSRYSVDEVVAQQRLDQVRAAVHLQLRAVLLLERRDAVGRVSLDQDRVTPLQGGTAPRRDVLGGVVEHLAARLLGGGRPVGGHDVVGPASQDHGERPARRLAHDLAHLLVPVVHRPAAEREAAVVVLSRARPGACMTPSRVRRCSRSVSSSRLLSSGPPAGSTFAI